MERWQNIHKVVVVGLGITGLSVVKHLTKTQHHITKTKKQQKKRYPSYNLVLSLSPQGAAEGIREPADLPVVLSEATAVSTLAGRDADPRRRNGRSSWGALEWGSAPCGQNEQMSGE